MKNFIYKLGTFLVLIIICNNLIALAIKTPYENKVKNEKSNFSKYRLKEFYELSNHENFDIIVLGSSHAYRSFNPEIISKKSGLNNFNLGSSGQTPMVSYFMLQEAFNYHKPKLIIFDIFYRSFYVEDNLKIGGNVFDYMKFSKNKIDFFLNGFTIREKLGLTIFPLIRYKDYLKSSIKAIIFKVKPTKKQSNTIQNVDNRGEYTIRGYVEKIDSVKIERLKKKNYFNDYKFDEKTLNSTQVAYLKKIIAECKKRSIPIILISTPIPHLSYSKIINPDSLHNFFNKLASESNSTFIDLSNPDVLGLQDTIHFFDNNHINFSGSLIFSEHISKVILTESLRN